MTSTDIDTDDRTDESATVHLGTPPPSAIYDGCFTASDISARYKDNFPHGGTRDEIHAAQEDMRRAHVRLVGPRAGGRGSSTPRRPAAPVVLQPTETEDGALVITCAGSCGETKSFKKFPTLSGGRPGREGVCRSCRDAALAERKGKGK